MKDRVSILVVFCLTVLGMLRCAVAAEAASPRNYLEHSPNARYLQWQDGTPFYIHADTAWALPRDYPRDEVIEYLDKTVEQKFSAVQMSAVFHAVRPNQDLMGPAFHEGDFLRPKEDYWANVDWVVEETTRRGLVAILNPIWKKQLAGAIRDNGPEKSRAYGRWFGGRYKDNPRVIYFLGGDAAPDPVRSEIIAMGEGIQEVYEGRAIVAYHSRSDTTSFDAFPDRPSWLTLNWTYSYCPRYREILWWTLRPDMENEVLVGGYGIWRTDEFAVAAVSEDRRLAVVYTPVRHALQLELSGLATGRIEAAWFDPTSGVSSSPNGWNAESRGWVTVRSPEKNSAGDADHVLVLTVQ